MPCKLGQIGLAFGSQGDCGWSLFTYGEDCPMSEMLRPNFFNPMHTLLKLGDLLLLGSAPSRTSLQPSRADGGKLLAMVAGNEKGQVRLRTLIDFGLPGDPDLVQGRVLEDLLKGVMGMGR